MYVTVVVFRFHLLCFFTSQSTIFHLYVTCIPNYHRNVSYTIMDFSACVHDVICTRENKIDKGCSKIDVCFDSLRPSHQFFS